MKNSYEFETKDFYLACVCLASGLKLIRLEKNSGKIVTFIFEDPHNQAQKIIQNHWSRKNQLPSRNLIEAINELKTRLYSGI